MLKYKKPLRVAILFTDHQTKTYHIHQELTTDSQDDLWHFLDHYQKSLDQRMPPDPGEVDEWDESLPTQEPLIPAQAMADIYEKQDLFWAQEKPLYIMIELIEIGVFGMIFIAADNMLTRIIDEFFGDEMIQANG